MSMQSVASPVYIPVPPNPKALRHIPGNEGWQFIGNTLSEAWRDGVQIVAAASREKMPARQPQRIGSRHPEIRQRFMHIAKCSTSRMRLRGVWRRHRYPGQEFDQTGGPARNDLHLRTGAIPHGPWHRQAMIRKMIEQREKEGQISFVDALLIEREDESVRSCVDQEIAVLDALGDALCRNKGADIVAGE